MCKTPFQRHAEIIASALSLCEQSFQKAIEEGGRIESDPVDVWCDMADILRIARSRLIEEVGKRKP